MERSISISELSVENGVAVVNAYGLIIGDNEDHVDDSITEVFWYLYVTTVEIPLFGLEFEKLIWPVLFVNIDLNWPYIFWDRTYCDSKGQCVSLWRSHWSNIWCWTTSLWTHSRCRAEQRVQLTRHISKFIWRQNSTSQIEKCQLKRIENFETHEQCACIRQAGEGFMKNSVYLFGWNVSSEGKWSKTSANSLLVAPPKPSEAFR